MMKSKDGLYGHVTGTVSRTIKENAFVVEYTRPNAQYPDRVAVWEADFLADGSVRVGDHVTVSGYLSFRTTEKDGKTYVDVSMNKPLIRDHERPGGFGAAPNDEEPF